MAKHTYNAVLKRGMTYSVLEPNANDPRKPTEHHFKKGDPKPVTNKVKALLEKSAVDTLSIPNGDGGYDNEERPKFDFIKIDDEGTDGGTEEPTARKRAPAA